ncbi:MAG: hypothetical protein KBC41_01540 [Candidatus Pacebacteria bacterium]|nr:hypothetical protein [Candidatus Paceibacterota bacterium]
MYTSINSKVYEKGVAFISSKKGGTLLILWSFFEASFWFIAPDFLLGIFGIVKPKEKNRFFVLAFIASFFGGVTYYVFNILSFDTMSFILRETPFVTERMMSFIRGVYATYGLPGVLFQSFSFMSFKIWTHLAIESNLNPIGYFLLVMISRSLRLYPVIFFASLIGKFFPDFIRKHFVTILVAYSVFFILMLVSVEL